MTPQYTLSVAGFLSLVGGLLLCWPKVRKSFITVGWSFLSWLSLGSAGICAFLMGVYFSSCLDKSGDPLLCNSVQLLSELGAGDAEFQVALEFTGVIVYSIGQLVVIIALQPKIIFGNPFRARPTGAFYEEIIDG